MMEIHEVLCSIGVRKSYRGYILIVEANKILKEDESGFTHITTVYQQVANKIGCNWGNVEKNIRTIIDHVWNYYLDELVQLASYHLIDKPTVSEFLEILHVATTESKKDGSVQYPK